MTLNVSDPDSAALPFEYGLVFHGPADWKAWNAAHTNAVSSAVRKHVRSEIRKYGIPDHPLGLAIPRNALHALSAEGGDVVYACETSATRALLAGLRDLASTENRYSCRRLKILAKGLLPRHLTRLRKAHPFTVSTETATAPTAGIGYDLVLADLTQTEAAEVFSELSSLAEYLVSHGRLMAALPFKPEPDNGPASSVSWPIIGDLKKIGFDTTTVRWYASQSKGIVGEDGRGVFVADSRKSPSRAAPQARRPEGFIGVIGLPRSGTTMLTALLEANSQIQGVYEPWNANIKRYSSTIGVTDINELDTRDPFDLSIDEFMAEFKIALSPQDRWLLVKETTTYRPYIDAMEALLSKPASPAKRHLIWLVRTPFHVYLSELEARKKWWGSPDLDHSPELFTRWATRSLRSVHWLRALARRFDGTIVSYESLARDTEKTLERLMTRMDIPFEAEQLSFHKTLRKSAVKGDLGLAKNPQAVSDRSLASRQAEFERLRDSIVGLPLFAPIEALSNWTLGLAGRGAIGGRDPLAGELDAIPLPSPLKKRTRS